ncbi:MAG: ORF6N domain-containing protein [Verrucomicrobia bacterium]|nr:ORF6N domain-containing protein [Verrucomicrobiota bacterium]
MKTGKAIQPVYDIADAILTVRGERVLLDSDLARLYGVETKALNRAVQRNLDRFPRDFRFQLTRAEFGNLKYQIGTSSSGHGGRRKLPWALTEHGAIMVANVLNSPQAARNLKSRIGNLQSSEAWRPPPAPKPLRRQIGLHVRPTTNPPARRKEANDEQAFCL